MWWGKRLFRNVVADDAGPWHRAAATEDSPLLDTDIRRTYQHLLLKQHRRLLISWLSLIVVLFVGLMNDFFNVVPPWYLGMPLFGYALWLGLQFQRVSREAERSSRLRRGLCPACVYGLTGVPPRPDGLTICPECAAAWRISEVPDPAGGK